MTRKKGRTLKWVGCDDCGKKRERCRPVMQLVSGVLIFICPQCWRELEYDLYLPQQGEAGPR